MRLSPASRLLVQTPTRRYATAAAKGKYVKRITVSPCLRRLNAISIISFVRE